MLTMPIKKIKKINNIWTYVHILLKMLHIIKSYNNFNCKIEFLIMGKSSN